MTSKLEDDTKSDKFDETTIPVDEIRVSDTNVIKSGDDATECQTLPPDTSPESAHSHRHQQQQKPSQAKIIAKQPDFIKLTSGNIPKNVMRVKMLPSSLKITQLNQNKVNTIGDHKLQIVHLKQNSADTTARSTASGISNTATIVSASSSPHFTAAQKTLHLTKVSHLNISKNIIVSSLGAVDATSVAAATSTSKSVILNTGDVASISGSKTIIPMRSLSNEIKILRANLQTLQNYSGGAANLISTSNASPVVVAATGVSQSQSQLLKSNNLKIIKTLPMSTTVTSSSIASPQSPPLEPTPQIDIPMQLSPDENPAPILKSIFAKAISPSAVSVIKSPPMNKAELEPQEKVLNVQISNGVLTDPHGAIKLLKSDSATVDVETEELPKLAAVRITPDKDAARKPILKNKHHVLEASPRLRSKSLTINKNKGKKVPGSRRSSLPPSSVSQGSSSKFARKILQVARDALNDKIREDPQPASLLCNEQLDTVSTNSSSIKNDSNTSGGSVSLSSSIEEKTAEDVPAEIQEDEESVENLNDEEDESTSSSSLIMAICGNNGTSSGPKKSDKEIKNKILLNLNKTFTSDYISRISRKYFLSKGKDGYQKTLEEDPFDYIEWDDGIGSLQNSNLHFKFNEFGIVEIVDNNELESIKKQQVLELNMRPLNERIVNEINRKQNIIEKNEPLYTCQKCSSVGLAKEFYTPEFCCINCFNEHKSDRITEAVAKQSNVGATPIKSPVSEKGAADRKKEKNQLECNSNTTISDDEYDRNLCSSKVSIPVPLPNEFSWDRYLTKFPGHPVSKRCFANAFPPSHLPNRFIVGHKLEAIDPENSSVISVCTVVDKQGYRIKIAFDGYPRCYDFWVNADSLDLLPCGFCHSTGRRLRVPPLFNEEMFNWDAYLSDTGSMAAPKYCFQYAFMSTFENPFKVGMKLEADDLKNSEKVCVATVRDVIRTRILVHFDGWDDIYDYWASVTSPYIHPVDWHKENGFILTLPPGKTNFTWKRYLEETNSFPAPRHYFSPRKAVEFIIGMKLEAVDKRVPALIRPATVVAIDENEVKIHFDGWPLHCSYWVKDDSPDLHPIKWGAKTGHIVEFPPDFGPRFKNSCGIKGCRGIGNAMEFEKPYHYSTDECPYDKKNYFKSRKIVNRLDYRSKETDRYFQKHNALKRPYNTSTTSSPNRPTSADRNQQKKPKLAAKDIELLQHPRSVAPGQTRSSSPHVNSNIIIAGRSARQQKLINEIQKRVNTSKNFLIDYGPRLHQVHQLWQRNTKVVTRQIPSSFNTSNPLSWDVETVSKYISALPNCTSLGELFKQHEIDGVALLSLNQKDLLKHMNLKLGPTIIIYNQIIHLREECAVKFLP